MNIVFQYNDAINAVIPNSVIVSIINKLVSTPTSKIKPLLSIKHRKKIDSVNGFSKSSNG